MTDDQTNALERASHLMRETSKALKAVTNELDSLIDRIDSQPHPENVTTEKEADA